MIAASKATAWENAQAIAQEELPEPVVFPSLLRNVAVREAIAYRAAQEFDNLVVAFKARRIVP